MPRRRMARMPRQVVQSYKQVRNVAPASIAAGTQTVITIASGVDNYTGPGGSNNLVPTGCVIKSFDIQIGFQNLVNVASFVWVTIQHIRSGQSAIDAQAVGGDPQRNQVHLQLQRTLGMNQNRDFHIRFKVPKKFQRVNEGTSWMVTLKSDTIRTEALQSIFKFYR